MTGSFKPRRHLNEFVDPLQVFGEGAKEYSNILKTAQYYQNIQSILRQAVDPAMGAHVYVIGFDQRELQIAVPNAGYASKLRHLVPSLSTALRAENHIVERIRIKTMASTTPTKPVAPIPNPYDSHHACIQALKSLYATLPEGEFAEGIKRILDKNG